VLDTNGESLALLFLLVMPVSEPEETADVTHVLSKGPRLFAPCIAFPSPGSIYKLNLVPIVFQGVQALDTDHPKQR